MTGMPEGYRFSTTLQPWNGGAVDEMLCFGDNGQCDQPPVTVILANDGCFTGVAICANEQHAMEVLTDLWWVEDEQLTHAFCQP